MVIDMETRKLETEITQPCHVGGRAGQDTGTHTTTVKDCRQEFLALLPWLQPHLITQSNDGSAPYKEEREVLIGTRVTKEGQWIRLKGDLKPRTMGATC